MRRTPSTTSLLLLVIAVGCASGSGDGSPSAGAADAAPTFDADRILQDVAALSADEMAGRGTGTEGEERAAAYIENRFREAGLESVGGSYRQDVHLVGMQKVLDASRIEIEGPDGPLPLRPADNLVFWSTAQQDIVDIESAPLLFVGYGVEAPEYDWDDYKGVDVEGKVLLMLNDDPQVAEDGTVLFGGEARTYYGRWTYKFEQAMHHGAAGALVVHTTPSASYPFSVIQNSGSSERFALDLPGAGYQVPLLGWLDASLSGTVAASIGTDVDGLFAMANRRDFEPVETGYSVSSHIETTVRRIDTANVMAMLPGADPELSEQVLVFSAHYDHIGTNPALDDDPIFNGAWDNAAGTAAIMALAEAFAAIDPAPRRSILFLACAAEESGLLGSAWFAAQPPIPLSRIVADFNIDMPQIFGVTRDLSVIGADTNTLGDVLRAVASETTVPAADGGNATLRIVGDQNPGAGSFYRSDQVNFAKAGVPSLYFEPGGDYVQELGFDPEAYRRAHYHQASDEIREEWDLSGLARDLGVVFRTAARVADADEMPRWVPGNEFEGAWMRLHGAGE